MTASQNGPSGDMVIRSTSGAELYRIPVDEALQQHTVLSLDGSGVRYRVADIAPLDNDVTVTVEVVDDLDVEPGARSDRSTAPRTTMVRSSDRVDVALHHLGGSGPKLLITHGTGFHGLAYAPLGQLLTTHFDVWALDLRGHGHSTAPPSGDFSWRGMADDVRAAADSIGGTDLYAVGNSLGGGAMLLAEDADPGLFRAAFLWEPIVLGAQQDLAPSDGGMGRLARNRKPTFDSKRAVRERYGAKPPFNSFRPDSLAAYVEHGFVTSPDGGVRLACEPEHEARTFEASDKPSVLLVERLRLPMLIAVGGDQSEAVPAQLAPGVVDAARNGELRRYPGLGHLGMLEDPMTVAADITGWFRQLTD